MNSSCENISPSDLERGELSPATSETSGDPASDEEDDCEGYFLEPSTCTVNIAERIAEANRALYLDTSGITAGEDRPRKVQFSEKLVNFESPECYSEDGYNDSEGVTSNSEEEGNCKEEPDSLDQKEEKTSRRLNRPKTANKELKQKARETNNIEEDKNQLEEEEGVEEPEEEEEAEEEAEAEEEVASDEVDDDVVISPFNGRAEKQVEEDVPEEAVHSKLLLVLLPREQSSSCESLIGEEISEDGKQEEEVVEEEKEDKVVEVQGEELNGDQDAPEDTQEEVTPQKTETRSLDICDSVDTIKHSPKPEKEKYKTRKKQSQKKNYKLKQISPDLNYSYEKEEKKKEGKKNKKKISRRVIKVKCEKEEEEVGEVDEKTEEKQVEKIVKERHEEERKVVAVTIVNHSLEVPKSKEPLKERKENHILRPKSCYGRDKPRERGPQRPKTAPSQRSCCVSRANLPRYEGLRSEYGLSAEQLQERRRRTFEIRQQKKMDKITRRQEEIQKRLANEENFIEWLRNKGRRMRKCGICKKSKKSDTLLRSDVYIQNHAVYASRRGISYSVDYSIGQTATVKDQGRLSLGDLPLKERRQTKTRELNLDRLFEDVSPHVKRTYRIYLGVESDK